MPCTLYLSIFLKGVLIVEIMYLSNVFKHLIACYLQANVT